MRLIGNLLRIISGTSLLIMSTSAIAGESSGRVRITELYMPASGGLVRVRVDKPIVNPDQCGGSEFYIKELTAAQEDRFVSVVMSAFLAGKEVSFWISGCTTGSYWYATRPVMSDIYVFP